MKKILIEVVFYLSIPALAVIYFVHPLLPKKKRCDGRVTDYNPFTDKW